jgi:negative regulator of sigma-B (phosphoserine phosphatase)
MDIIMISTTTFNLTLGYVTKPLEGEIESGDLWLIKETPNYVLVALADGLGHGKDAAYAAKKAIAALEDIHSSYASLIDLMNACHMELQGTRGVALTLVKIQPTYAVEWLGVGNVIGTHWPNMYSHTKTEGLFTQGGVVGYQMPALHVSHFTAGPGHTLILATDGLKSEFSTAQPIYKSAQQIAEELFKKYHTNHDDAAIVVIQWGFEQ